MELTVAEFASFNLKSKSQILSYKATLVSRISSGDCELQLYCMCGNYFIKQVCNHSGVPEKIEPVFHPDMLYLFAKDIDISSLLPN